MKNINKIIACFTLLGLIGTSCSNLEELNINDRNITKDQLLIDYQHVGSKFKPIFENIYKYNPEPTFQLQQNLNADVFSGYMTNPRPFGAGTNNLSYALNSGWNGFIWSVPYNNVMNNIKGINDESNGEFPTLEAIAAILKVEAMHRVSDVFGPIVYTNFGDLTNAGVYDSQQKAYNTFFADLDSATTTLMADIDNTRFTAFDLSYKGNYSKWVTFANSLRLRLAIRISKVDPVKAKQEGEKALSHPLGVLKSNGENFVVNSDLPHPIGTIDNSWGDIRMNATMESILKGYKDPRIEKYFNLSIKYPTQYKGIRNGMPLESQYEDEHAQKAAYVDFSGINDDIHGSKVQLMTAAEVYFLKAEAALRQWANAGDAKINYETGISISFGQHGASGDVIYIADNTSVPEDYVDPVNPSNNITAMTSATIAWNSAGTNEEKLEKIITQKWIAMFPEGQEAWSEYRRTGYPKIFPVLSNQSAGTIDTAIQVRRIPFVDSELSTNPAGVSNAVSLLKGPDNGGTRLWWDTGANNF
ncbi:RagB/SusD family nutrient uptake outer membrane protein [Tenacibaculum sp.]|nr:RagB/SusD family nutrient uptake outer membrane protein [Tenacibaculum sp.]